jgi:hypothetical protein
VNVHPIALRMQGIRPTFFIPTEPPATIVPMVAQGFLATRSAACGEWRDLRQGRGTHRRCARPMEMLPPRMGVPDEVREQPWAVRRENGGAALPGGHSR